MAFSCCLTVEISLYSSHQCFFFFTMNSILFESVTPVVFGTLNVFEKASTRLGNFLIEMLHLIYRVKTMYPTYFFGQAIKLELPEQFVFHNNS